jgi:phage/plasmid-like protein (TIGR03299 family)
MAYFGDTPWHDLGQQLPAGCSIEEALRLAYMDYDLRKSYVRYAISRDAGPDQYRKVDDKVVVFRGDNYNDVGVVGAKFELVQNRDMFEVMRKKCQEHGATIETLGNLFGGRKMWILARMGEGASIADPADKIRPYLLGCTACDGTMATTFKFVYTRAVCNNTVTAGLGESGGTTVKVSHKSKFNPADVRVQLGLDERQANFDSFINDMRNLAATHMSNETMIAATVELFKPGIYGQPDKAKEIDSAIRSKPVSRILEMAINGNGAIGGGMGGVQGTAYGWLNSVTQYVDHEARTHGETPLDNRIESAWFGKGDTMKTRAIEMAGQVSAATQAARGTAAALTETPTATLDSSDLLASLLSKPIRDR